MFNGNNNPLFVYVVESISRYSDTIVREQTERNKISVLLPGMPEDYTLKYVERSEKRGPYFGIFCDTRTRYLGDTADEVLSFIQGIRFVYMTSGFETCKS